MIFKRQVKRAVALLNKLVMVANRANNNKKQRYQQPNPLTKHSSQSESLNEIIQHREDEQLLLKNLAENVDDDHPVHPKAIALPRVSYIIFLAYIAIYPTFIRCYFSYLNMV